MKSMLNNQLEDERQWWYQPELAALVVLVIAIYFTRISAVPVVGEEGRWARGASEMIETGDWIVWRQQGHVFPEKPPLVCWAMAIGGLVRGSVDVVAIRLPSVLAVLLTSLMIFAYARTFVSRVGALICGAIYATLGQVLQIGRMGEAESLFTLFLSSALLTWHLGRVRRWSPVVTWIAGYSLAALAALVKGPQAPMYFVAVTTVFLIHQGQWRSLLSWSHAAGIATFLAVVGAWQIPYYFATDWNAVVSTWMGLAADRFSLRNLVEHVLTYPLETFACLLPWSPVLLFAIHRRVRQSLGDLRAPVTFLVTSLVITYPSVWFASGARGRYFMPLYPCMALLIGMIVERCARAEFTSRARISWNNFLLVLAVVVPVAGFVVAGATFVPLEQLAVLRQPHWFAIAFPAAGAMCSFILWKARRAVGPAPALVPVLALSAFLGLFSTGVMLNVNAKTFNNPAPLVAEVKAQLPPSIRLVSFGPIDHRFAHYYESAIEELPWPMTADQVSDDVTYFCVGRHPSDTPEVRITGRGRVAWTTPGTLPFQWEEIAAVPVQRIQKEGPQPVVVIGRIVRPAVAAADAKAAQPVAHVRK